MTPFKFRPLWVDLINPRSLLDAMIFYRVTVIYQSPDPGAVYRDRDGGAVAMIHTMVAPDRVTAVRFCKHLDVAMAEVPS